MDTTERIDRILDAVGTRLTSEIEGLLATEFLIESAGSTFIDKENAFAELKGKQICSQIEIVGDISGSGCLLMGIKDGIRLGGTLIMLPGAELDEVIGREEYSEEIEDSYGEIANIIAGAFTADFGEMYTKAYRFIRKEQELVVPKEVDVESSQPIENQLYYKSTYKMALAGRALGNLILLLPAASFGLEKEVSSESETADNVSEENTQERMGDSVPSASGSKSTAGFSNNKQNIDLSEDSSTDENGNISNYTSFQADDNVESQSEIENEATEPKGANQKEQESLPEAVEQENDISSSSHASPEKYQSVGSFEILLVSDDQEQTERIMRVLQEVGYDCKSISSKENIQNYIPGHLKAVYLVMTEVNERAFGLAIQISSASSLPIIAAGSSWTRSKVIKAVKYGIHDILLTPASDDDIKENITNNLLKKAA